VVGCLVYVDRFPASCLLSSPPICSTAFGQGLGDHWDQPVWWPTLIAGAAPFAVVWRPRQRFSADAQVQRMRAVPKVGVAKKTWLRVAMPHEVRPTMSLGGRCRADERASGTGLVCVLRFSD
jgi:hypothetical protein